MTPSHNAGTGHTDRRDAAPTGPAAADDDHEEGLAVVDFF